MQFKEWLYNEEDAGMDGPGGNYWDLVYPSNTGDYGSDSGDTKYHWWMQWRLERGLEIGRPVYNVDVKDFVNRKYTSVASTTIPKNSGFWEHKPDNGKGYLNILKNVEINPIGINGKVITDKPQITHGFKDAFPPPNMGNEKLNQMFGDKTGKWPEMTDGLKANRSFQQSG